MELYGLLYEWVPRFLRLPILYFLYFVILIGNGIFLGNTINMYSSLGVNAEPYTMAYNAMYIGMGLGLILHARLKMRFSNKELLFRGLTWMLLMNIVCATTSNTTLIVLACLMIGFTKISALIELYVIWMFIWSKKGDTSRMYPFVYFTALAGLHFVTWTVTRLTDTYNWRYAYIWIIILLLICLLFAFVFVENHPLKKRIPFYQVDYAGLILLASSMMLLNYVVVYGKVEDWLESNKIIGALFGAAISFLLFIKRGLRIKRPILNLGLFKFANFRLGLLYFLILGIFLPGTFQSAFTGSILHYEMTTNMELNLYLIPGILAGCILCYFWYLKKCDPEILIIMGFLAFVIYHFMMYNNFVSVFDIRNFWLPVVIKGFGTSLLYIAIGLYTTQKLGITVVMGAAGVMILVRSFLGSGVCSSFYSYFLYSERIKRFDYLAGKVDANNYLVKEQGGLLAVYKDLQEQAILTTSKEITGYIIIAGIVLLVIITLSYIYQKLRNTIAAS
jgi:hypothetical protein